MSKDDRSEDATDLSRPDNRIALGVALGAPLGVLISILLDSWAFIGVGLVLGVVIGAIPPRTGSTGELEDSEE